MNLVQFEDGTYGVRRGGWFGGYQFRALHGQGEWWAAPENVAQFCKGTREEAEAAFRCVDIKHKVIR